MLSKAVQRYRENCIRLCLILAKLHECNYLGKYHKHLQFLCRRNLRDMSNTM